MHDPYPKKLADEIQKVILATHHLFCKMVVGATVIRGDEVRRVTHVTLTGKGYNLEVEAEGNPRKEYWPLGDAEVIIPLEESYPVHRTKKNGDLPEKRTDQTP